MVWHIALWVTMKKYNISENLIRVIKHLYVKCSPLQQLHRNWFQTTVEVRQGCLFSPTHFNIFLERVMTYTSEDHKGRTITNLSFADDIDGLAGEEEELAKLADRLNKASTAYGIEISAKKTKSGNSKEIKVSGQKLKTVTSFKYLGSVVSVRVPSLRYSPG